MQGERRDLDRKQNVEYVFVVQLRRHLLVFFAYNKCSVGPHSCAAYCCSINWKLSCVSDRYNKVRIAAPAAGRTMVDHQSSLCAGLAQA
jgi:hypothetical protein